MDLCAEMKKGITELELLITANDIGDVYPENLKTAKDDIEEISVAVSSIAKK